MKPLRRRENKINEDVSKVLKNLQEEKQRLKESIEFEFKFNNELKTEIKELKSENDHLKRENERLIDIENRTRISNDNLWSLIEQLKTKFDSKPQNIPNFENASTQTSAAETKRRPNNSWVDMRFWI